MLESLVTHPVVKTLIAAVVISYSSWLAGRKPALAGFIIALPITSLLALLFTQYQFRDSTKTVEFARSIFVSVPLSLLFFVPFLFAQRLHLPFRMLYLLGLALLIAGFVIHRAIFPSG